MKESCKGVREEWINLHSLNIKEWWCVHFFTVFEHKWGGVDKILPSIKKERKKENRRSMRRRVVVIEMCICDVYHLCKSNDFTGFSWIFLNTFALFEKVMMKRYFLHVITNFAPPSSYILSSERVHGFLLKTHFWNFLKIM